MRILLRLLVALLGLAVAAAGLVLAVEVGWDWWRPGHGSLLVPWHQWLARLRPLNWTSAPVRIGSALVALGGLVLLLIAAGARQPRRLRLDGTSEHVTVVTSPRSLARLVGRAVRAQDGVSGATVTASRRRVRVQARSRLNTKEELVPRLTEAATDAVAGLPLPRTPRVSVTVSRRES